MPLLKKKKEKKVVIEWYLWKNQEALREGGGVINLLAAFSTEYCWLSQWL